MNKRKVKNLLLDHTIEILLIVVILVMWITTPSFMTSDNLWNILRNQSMKGVIAFGMTLVIIAGQIDLSIGSQVALTGVIVARMCRDLPEMTGMSKGAACAIGILLSLVLAIIIGFVHAFLQHKFNMPAFIITLADLNILYGLAGIICQGFPIANEFPEGFEKLGTGKIFGQVPIPALILLAVFALCYIFLNFTTTGRAVYAVGGNAESARLSGINVFRTKIVVFAVVQVMCVLAGLMHSSQVASGSFSFGRGWEVDVISAVAIGGTNMNGGIGKAWGTLMGVLFLGVITNAMTILNLDVYLQYVIKGLVMVLAVLLSTYQAKAKA